MASVTEHQETAVLDLGALLYARDGAVVILVAGKTRLAAHRAVLEAGSPVFSAMFSNDMQEASSGEVNILDVEGPVLRQLLAYLYTGRAPKLPGLAPQLLAAADKYGVSTLKDACEQQVAAQLDLESAAAAAVLAVRHSCHTLRQAAIAFIRDNYYPVMATKGWADALRNQPEDVVEFTRLLVEPPEGTRSLSPQEKGRRLLQAAEDGAVQPLQELLAAGADVMVRGEGGRTALHETASEGHVEAARCLLEGGAVVDARTDNLNTPLHWAAKFGHVAVVRLLLASSADHSARNAEECTPLHWAAWKGHAEVATALLQAGASRQARDGKGRTTLDIARHFNKHQLVEMLGEN